MYFLVYKKFPESNYREARKRYNKPAFRVYLEAITHLRGGGSPHGDATGERVDGDGVFPRRHSECPADSLVLTIER